MSRAGILQKALLPALVAAAVGAGAGACGGTDTDPPDPNTTGTSSGVVDPPANPTHVWTECQASDQAWVRRALLAVSGRRGWGQAEVNAYEDILKGVRAADRKAAGKFGDIGASLPSEGGDIENGKRLIARAMMQENAFRERWSDFLMDALRVVRIEIKSQQSCYGPPNPNALDDGTLARFVRDNDSSNGATPLPNFTMGQLLSSAIQLDDLSVVYRAHLFAMMSLPIYGANVSFEAMERIQRQDFGTIFSTSYLHRDLVCLACHNSEFSVTYNEDPALNRAWPTPGLFEQALFGASNGKHPADEVPTKGPDDLRFYSMFRVVNVVGGNQRPWGWSGQCGGFNVPQQPDPLNIDAYFAGIHSTPAEPQKGLYASIWDVERALHRGVDKLAAHGLTRLGAGKLGDEDEAFAYLVAQTIVEKVWNEIIGSRLTVANYFPRTQVQRDVLMTLTEHFVATHFSLKTLIEDILAHPVFNMRSPDEGCGASAYEMPNVLDPWTVSESDLGKRANSPADGVFALSSRLLVRSLHRAMEWAYLPEYPQQEQDEIFQVSIGYFIKDADPGFRGLDFQGRLSYEDNYATCTPYGNNNDFIKKIVATAAATPGATTSDAIIALKDRLLGEPSIDAGEQADLDALLQKPINGPVDVASLEGSLRTVCGVLVSSPQFMMGGLAPKDTRDVPKLSPPEINYGGTCGYLAGFLGGTTPAYTVTCANGAVTITRK